MCSLTKLAYYKLILGKVIMKKLLLTIALSTTIINSFACTAVDIQAKDGSIVAGRTMEWAYPMAWELLYIPVGSDYKLNAPDNLKLAPIPIKSKYGVVAIASGLASDAILDGQNSAGLAFSGNFLPGFTQYQEVSKKDKYYVSIFDFGKFVLGNFATVAEAKSELSKYKVWTPPKSPTLPTPPTLHVLLTDKSGQTLVIEFINGQMKFFDKTAGVLTNAPTYDWHLINVRNYLNLSNNAVGQINSLSHGNVTELGQGGGAIGLPGDYTPPSRFIRTTFLKSTASKTNNANEAVELTGHILNNVDIPLGVVSSKDNGKTISDYTQWVAIKDLSHNMLYFSDYNHRLNYVKIDLNQIFKKPQEFKLPIEKFNYPTNDITSTILN